MAVKDVVSRPDTTRTLRNLLQMSEENFLRMVRIHALPWLVLKKKVDVIAKIAEAQHQAVVELMMEPRNASAVIALLMVQDVGNVMEFVQACLRQVSNALDAELLVQTYPAAVALELLKIAADLSEDRKSRVSYTCQAAKPFLTFCRHSMPLCRSR